MRLARAIRLFSAQPWANLFLAALLLLMGVAFLAGWVPSSSVRRYFPGHEWVMAAICSVVAALLIYCWLVGIRNRNKECSK